MYASDRLPHRPVIDRSVTPPGRLVTMTAWSAAALLVCFALVNVAFELTGRFVGGPYGRYASQISVMDWLMVMLKLVGAGLALLSVSRRRVLPVGLLGMLVWGGFATLGVYAAGNIVESIGMLVGLIDPGRPIRLLDVGYVVFFAVVATLWGVLAMSYARRARLQRLPVALGMIGAPGLIAAVLLVVPTMLGILPG